VGLDYIRDSKGKQFIKQWAKGLSDAKLADLFDPTFTQRRRLVSAVLVKGAKVTVGQHLTVDLSEEVKVSDGICHVATVQSPPADVVAWLREHDNNGLATIERISLFGDMLELSLQ
jgi:hypothetical protein